jgi:hypothetical protein
VMLLVCAPDMGREATVASATNRRRMGIGIAMAA